MSKLPRFIVLSVAALLGAVACVQVRDGWVWARTPWLGFSVGGWGEVLVRNEHDVPAGLRARGHDKLVLEALRAGEGGWTPVARLGDEEWNAWGRAREQLAGLAPGARVGVRLRSAGGAVLQDEVVVRKLPARLVLERFGLFSGLGIVVAAFGVAVFVARPESALALSFAVFCLTTGFAWLASQVVGGMPSQFALLGRGASYATPAASVSLALSFERRPFVSRLPGLHVAPWLASFLGLLVERVRGEATGAWLLGGLRLAAWLFFLGYTLYLRSTSPSRHRRTQLDVYLLGLAVSFGPATFAYARQGLGGPHPSPYVMLPLVAFPAVLGYGILRYGLFDVELLVRRGVALSVLTVLLAGAYAGVMAGVGSLLDPALAGSPVLSAGFLFLALLGGLRLREPLQRLVDRGLNPRRFRYLEAMRDASARLALLGSAQEVGQSLLDVAIRVLGVEAALVYGREGGRLRLLARHGGATSRASAEIPRDDCLVRLTAALSTEIFQSDFESNPRLRELGAGCLPRMQQMGAQLLVPLGGGSTGLVGLLALGPRRGGQPYNLEDVTLLRALAAQAAASLVRTGGLADDSTYDRTAPIPLEEGARIGHYQLEERLGEGGMGVVYRAMDTRLERQVALKFLTEEHRAKPERLLRLRREARALAALSHPGITQIYALEVAAGHVFLSIELVPGRSLKQELMERGRLATREAVRVLRDLAQALGYAREQGIIHRDIKLGNVMRTPEGTVKLMDFGLARLAEADDTSITATGAVVGTPAYMAPEILVSGEGDHRADLYALGVMLHQMLVGSHPWGLQGARGSLTDPIALQVLVERGVPEPLAPVLRSLLDPDPERRCASYELLVEELDRAVAAL